MSDPSPRYFYINPANGDQELYAGIEKYIKFYIYEASHEAIGKLAPAQMYSVKKKQL